MPIHNDGYISRLQTYPVKEGLTGSQTIDLLVKRVQTLGGQQTGQFLVDCDTYASMSSPIGKVLSLIQNLLIKIEHAIMPYPLVIEQVVVS